MVSSFMQKRASIFNTNNARSFLTNNMKPYEVQFLVTFWLPSKRITSELVLWQR